LTEEARPQHVLLQSNSIDSGFYYFFVYRLTERSARTKNILESIFLDENLKEIGDIFKGEQVLGEMVEQGQDPAEPLEIPRETARQSHDKAEQLLVKRLAQITENAKESNDRFIQSRINSLEVFYDRILNRKNELLANANREGKNESYIKRLRTTIQNKENEKDARIRELEGQREVNIAYERVASGIVEVTEF
jgi:isoleucyl-tRNA synthetase